MSEDATLDEFVREEVNENSEWNESKLEDLLSELLTGGRPTGGGLDEGEYISIGGTQVNSEGYIDLHDLVYIPEEYFEQVKETQLQKHDILVVKDGANTGDVAIAWESDNRIVTNEHLFTLRPDSSINSPYLFYFLLSYQGWKQINGTITGSAQEGINRGFTRKVDIQFPPLHEQRKIATVLYTIDRAIEKTEEIITQTQRLKEGAMQDLFSRGVRSYDDFQETKYGTIPASWEVKPVGEIADRIGSGGTPNTDNGEYYGGDIEWVKTDDLNSGLVESTKTTITSVGLDESAAKLFPEGTVVFAMYGGALGQNGRLGIEAAMNQACCGIVTDESEMDSYFLHQQLIHRKKQLTALSAGTHQQNISQSMIEKFEVFVPPLDEQKEMVNILKNIERTIKTNTNEKERLKRLKRGVMQDLLSGTVRTTDTDIEVPEEVAQYG